MKLLPFFLLMACSATKPYGESMCKKMDWVPAPIASEQPASAEAASAPVASTGDFRVDQLALKVRSKRKELDSREADLVKREEKLKAELAAFAASKTAEKEKEMKLAADAKAAQTAKPGAAQQTIALMQPKSAAKVIEAMDDRSAAKMVMSLPPQTAAEVFQAMAPPRAAKISMLMRGKKQP